MKKGYTFISGGLIYEKQDDEDFGKWVCLNAKNTVEVMDEEGNSFSPKRYGLVDQPTDKRYGWHWTDAQVKKHFGL